MDDSNTLTIPTKGIVRAQRHTILRQHIRSLKHKGSNFAGFQTNQSVSFPAELKPLLQLNLLNLGDCWQSGHYRLNSKAFERAVLDYYAQMWHAAEPYWGYLTAMGSTEGNLYSLLAARDFLRQKHQCDPVLLFSANSHYSIRKAAHLLGLRTPAQQAERLGPGPLADASWPDQLPCLNNGQIDAELTIQVLSELLRQQLPCILCLTLGTTFTGVSDPWRQIADYVQQLKGESAAQHFWLHLDGALAANYLRFADNPDLQNLAPDFRHPLLHSVCVSPYKWLGLPMPMGLVMTRRLYQAELPQKADYTGCHDTTVAGSRSGLSAMLLWEVLCRRNYRNQQLLLRRLVHRLQQFHLQLRELFSIKARRDRQLFVLPLEPGSLIQVFSAPNALICKKFSLSVSVLQLQGSSHRCCHLVMLEHCDQPMLDRLLLALSQPGAFSD